MNAKFLLVAVALVTMLGSSAQNVGVGTATPTEKLDVIGNINVTGTIKAAGIAGQPGQVLTTNNAGNLQWNSLNAGGDNGYKNFVSFYGIFSTTDTWTVPAGVSKIMVEAWGGGGGGSITSGGGGGGYVKAPFTVTAGTVINITVGAGGASMPLGSFDPGSPGQNSVVAVKDVTNTTWYAVAVGGTGAYHNPGNDFVSSYNAGGSFYVSNQYPIGPGVIVYPSFLGAPGECGYPNSFTFTQTSATSFQQEATGGRGGDAGNSVHTGGSAARHLAGNGGISSRHAGQPGVFGGGGGAGMTGVGGAYGGGKGKVVIWY